MFCLQKTVVSTTGGTPIRLQMSPWVFQDVRSVGSRRLIEFRVWGQSSPQAVVHEGLKGLGLGNPKPETLNQVSRIMSARHMMATEKGSESLAVLEILRLLIRSSVYKSREVQRPKYLHLGPKYHSDCSS